MRVIRVYNNNVVATRTDDKEAIVQGSGVGFGKKPGDLIDEAKIEKIFFIKDDQLSKFEELLDDVPIEYFQIAEMIAQKATRDLNVSLDNQILIALADHIYFAVERYYKDASLSNFLNSEISYLYRKEYQIGLWALDRIEEMLKVRLPKDEAGLIALHIINSSTKASTQDISDTLIFIRGILDIIKEQFNITFDKENLDTTRLMTHLKFLANRVIYHENENIVELDDMYDLLVSKKKECKLCIEEIDDYIQDKFGYKLSKQEKVYLLVHLLRFLH